MLRYCAGALRTPRRTLATVAAPQNQAVTEVWDALMETDWVDRETVIQEELVEKAEKIIASYRRRYDGNAVQSGDAKDEYEKMEALYQAKEAAQIVDLYAEHIDHIIRDHEDMVGFLGNNTEMPKGGADMATNTLKEYVEFVNKLENKELRRKVEFELGRKAVMLKMVLSSENFSVNIAPIAGGDFVTSTKK